MKKILSMVLASFMAVVTLFSATACNKGGEAVDNKKTQLYVNVLEIGVGFDFIQSLKTKFEAANATQSFEEGKQGVQVIITKSRLDADNLKGSLSSGETDIYYVANLSMSQFVTLSNQTSEFLEDITDVVMDGGESSIHNKLFDSTRDYFNVGGETPKYYALPWFSSYFGTVYDIGLFKEKHLYSTDEQSMLDYKGLDGVDDGVDDDWGPDGKQGTYDDGLPATWADFDLLMAEMKTQNITPFAFTNLDNYTTTWLQSLWASYEGKDNFQLMSDFDGTYTFNNDAGQVEELPINATNGYKVSEQQGKKAAISVAEKIIKNKWYEEQCFLSSTDNIKAQKIYLGSKAGAYENMQPIAFLMEGTWWENEAKDYFAQLAGRYGEEYAYGTREFGFMTFPRFTDANDDFVNPQVNTKTTIRGGSVSQYAASVFINKKSDQTALAKAFLKFAYSDEMNVDFTINSGVSKPMKYTMDDTALSQITPYQRSIYALSQNADVEVTSGSTNNKYVLNNSATVLDMAGFTSGENGKKLYSNVFDAFRNNSAMTKDTYWNGVLGMNYDEIWAKIGG